MLDKKITFDRFIRMLIGGAVFAAIIYLINYLSGVLLPFVVAVVIAYMVYPIVKFFQYKARLRYRAVAIIVTLVLVAAAVAAVVTFVVPPLVSETMHVKNLIAEELANNTAGGSIPDFVSKFIADNIDMNKVNEFLSEENLTKSISAVMPKLWNILSQSLSIVFGIVTVFMIVLYVYFILLDYETLENGWIKIVPPRYRPFASGLVDDLKAGMNRYFRGQGLVALITGVMSAVGFLTIDFPLAIGLGLLVGLLTLVPYLKVIALAPAALLAVVKAADTGQNFWIVLVSVIAVFAIVQVIEDSVIVPRIMGKLMGLNPALILLSLSVWGALMGIIGMIIALPMTTLIISYYKRFVIDRESIVKGD